MLKKRRSSAGYLLGYLFFALLFSLSLIIMALFVSRSGDTDKESSALSDKTEYPTVIIDAGHGGEDGGAIGKNGVYEKDLNLTIAKELAEMLRANRINVIMTRETDILLYDRNIDYHGRKKALDLAARVKIAEENPDCIFVSIHMNSFPQEKYRGLQVYYSQNTPESHALAESIQCSVSNYLKKANCRNIKSASDNIYLLKHIKNPAILIECGFISNYEECEMLCSEDYRRMLTLTLFCGICEYISQYSS